MNESLDELAGDYLCSDAMEISRVNLWRLRLEVLFRW